ncbi:MAG: 4'-phosphopantetheinyl transferase superfamily protein, partial [Propionibacteriaceae bacterium]
VAPTAVSPTELATLVAGLPPWRRAQYDQLRRFPDQAACAVAFALVERCWHQVESGPLPDVHIDSLGKPQLHSPWDFSLSHRNGWAVCALANIRVGVDISGPIANDGLAADIASTAEQSYCTQGTDLAPLWTRKEALAKRHGMGLIRELAALDTCDPALHTWVHRDMALTLSLACSALPTLPPRWKELEWPPLTSI